MEKVKRLSDLNKYVLPTVDVLFISKDIARANGYTCAKETLQCVAVGEQTRARFIVCAWGECGAAGAQRTKDNVWEFCECGPVTCESVVDTLGAGDMFNAGVIFSILNSGEDAVIYDAIDYGCRLAGRKCIQIGFEKLLKEPL